jgi:hypothetical protein
MGAQRQPIDFSRSLLVLAIGLSAAFVALVCYLPSGDDDLWWTLEVGDYIRTEGDVPRTALWTIDALRELPYVCHSWLAALALSSVAGAFGLDAVMIVPVVIALLVFACVIWLARELGASWLLSVTVAVVVLYPLTLRMTCRAEIFGYLFFAVSLVLIAGYHRTERIRHLAALVVVALVWANTHASFLLLLAVLPVVGAGRALDAWRRADYRRDALVASVFSRSTAAIAATWAGVAAASLVNPYGPDLLRSILEPSSADTFTRYIQEWRPLHLTRSLPPIFVAIPLVLIASVGIGFRKLSWVSRLAAPLLIALEFRAQRNVTVVAIGAAFVLGELAANRDVSRRVGNVVAGVLVAALLAGNALAVRSYGFEDRSLTRHPSPLISAQGLAFIRDHIRGNVLNQYQLGGLLIHFGYPQIRVSIDSRADPYPLDYYRSFRLALYGPGAETRAFVDRYAIDHIVVLRTTYDRYLRRKLAAIPDFQLAYEDTLVVVMSRVR